MPKGRLRRGEKEDVGGSSDIASKLCAKTYY